MNNDLERPHFAMTSFANPDATIFIPDGAAQQQALERTTLLGVGAHQDDIEILALHGILRGFGSRQEWFSSVTVTNGSGSPRDNLYADYTDQEMQQVRKREQQKAAVVGDYGFAAFLEYSSSEIKDPSNLSPVDDLAALIAAARPQAIYTHNPADKHDTHIAVVMCLVEALRRLPRDAQPGEFYGCEVWRDLDWLCDADKQTLDVSPHPNLAAALLGVYDSQICGGKRYDLAALGRRCANATFFSSHATDRSNALTFAMDLMPLLENSELDPAAYVEELIARFSASAAERIAAFRRRS